MQTTPPACDCCGRFARFRFAGTGAVPAFRCWRHAVFYDPVFRRALKVSAVIGTLLFLINQLDVVLSGKITLVVILKIILTYLVPFLVATYSALQINQLPKLAKAPPAPPGAVA